MVKNAQAPAREAVKYWSERTWLSSSVLVGEILSLHNR